MLLRRLSIVLGLLAAAGTGAWIFRDAMTTMTAPTVQTGAQTQSFNARTLTGDRILVGLSGQKTLLVFFKIDCPHCHGQLASVERLAGLYGGAGLNVIGLSRTEHEGLKTQRFSFPVYIDHSNAMIGRFGRVMVPTLVLVDETGVIRYIRSGAGSYETDRQIVEAFLRGALTGMRPSGQVALEENCCEESP